MIKGSIVALITPFHEDGSVNFEKLGELLDWHIANHTDGILVLGTTGESTTMTHEEDDAVVEFTLKRVNHRVPVIAGSGSAGDHTVLQQSQRRRHDPSFHDGCRCRQRTADPLQRTGQNRLLPECQCR